MSAYNQNPKMHLRVNTHDEVAEIFVIDAHFHLVDCGVGRSKIFDLDPGVYTVKVRTGSQTQEDYAILRLGEEGDAEPLVKDFPPLKFSSSAPLSNTTKTHEYQMSAAATHSREVHVHAGQGSSIFVFVRDWTPPTRPAVPRIGSPARGLTLRDAQGNFIADFARQSVSGNGGDPWSAGNVSVNPGLYRLSLETSSGAKLEQVVIASPGWQTQIFLLQRAYGESLDDRQADLPGASILHSRPQIGFDPSGDDMRLTELIRLGLSESRQILSDRIVDELLWGKFENPMLGIYGAHLLLLNKELASDRLHLVIANLRELLGRQHPDVEALALKVALDDVPSMLDYPPMLRKSWWYVLDATVRRPDLVPLGSFAANMAGRLWGDGIWLTWMTPAAGDAASVAERRQGAERTPQQSDTLGDFTASLLTSAPIREAIAQIRSDTQARGVRVPLNDDTARRLVYTLGIPRANVEDLLDKVNQQLTTFSIPVTSQKTKEQWLAEAHRLLGNMDYQGALDAFEQAIHLDPSYARAYNDKGIALNRLGRYEEALTAFEQAIRLDPNDARAYGRKGEALARLGRHQEALSAFEQTLRLDPGAHNDAVIYYNIIMANASPQGFKRLAGSERQLPANAHQIGPVDPHEPIEVSVYLRDPAPSSPAGNISEHAQQPGPRMTRAEYIAAHSAAPDDMAKGETFANEHHLTVVEKDPVSRRVVLAGTADAMTTAFATELQRYEYEGSTFRGRTGPLHIPNELDQIVVGVFGLDDRPQARPHMRLYNRTTASTPQASAGSTSYTLPQLAKLYDFPTGLDGSGQCIAIIELGGGYKHHDLVTYFQQANIALPRVSSVSVNHGRNHPVGKPDSADGEVDLDIEVAGSLAPGAHIVVYFAPNTDRGFIDAITQAIHDTTNNPSVISISWGGPEASWTAQAMQGMDQAFQAAAGLGITVCAAAGDNGSGDGVTTDQLAHVDFPASDPFVLGCGGTRLEATNNQVTSEVVWNEQANNEGATGGGISDFFDLPTWQANAHVPPSKNANQRVGRGVPDVAGDADPATGYQVYVDGQSTVFGGTSAGAPLWAGLIALMNQHRGQPIGYLNPILYQNYPQLVQSNALRDVTSGDNGAYAAGPGWDACTGLGTPDGARLLQALTASGQ